MKKTYRIIAAAAAGVLIVGLTITTIVFHDQKKSLQNQISGYYSKAFEQLLTDVTSLETKLYKLEASSGINQHAMLLMDVWRQAGDTESAISALPVSYASTSTLTQFMNRTSDYCRSLSRKVAGGEDLSADDFKQIRQLAA